MVVRSMQTGIQATVSDPEGQTPTTELMLAIGTRARAAARELALASTDGEKQGAPRGRTLAVDDMPPILDANAKDVEAAARPGVTPAFIDRLMLDATASNAIAKGLEDIAKLADPVGTVLSEWTRPNGLKSRACACRSASSASSTKAART